MIPRNLLWTVKHGQQISPHWLKTPEDDKLLEDILECFKNIEGQTTQELKTRLSNLKQNLSKYKVVRGLDTILMRTCEFDNVFSIDPMQIRSFLFQHGFVLDDQRREAILNDAAVQFQTTPQQIETLMFGDLEENQRIRHIPPITSQKLQQLYNLETTETLLAFAEDLQITLSSQYQEFFWTIKRLNLMYETTGTTIHVTGPLGIFQKNLRYGSAFAKLFSVLLKSPDWSLIAQINLPFQNKERIYTFKLDAKNLPEFPKYIDSKIEFDSTIERTFYREFRTNTSGWEIHREPSFLKVGDSVFIPDFSFSKPDLPDVVIYFEIVGFWTPEYLNRKQEKLSQVSAPLIIAVDETLAWKEDQVPGNCLKFKGKVSTKDVLHRLQQIEKDYINSHWGSVAISEINAGDQIISVNEKARELGILPGILVQLPIFEGVLIDKFIVPDEILTLISSEIGDEKLYPELERILHKYGLSNKVLDILGYKIQWNGLMPISVRKNADK